MGIITNEIREKARLLSINIEFISLSQYDSLLDKICNKFIMQNYAYPIWEHINDAISIQNPDAWKYIKDFIGNNKVILFLEKKEDTFACLIQNGKDLNRLLSETFGFVFYLTNSTFEYLICFNDHDFLIGSGTAKILIEQLSE